MFYYTIDDFVCSRNDKDGHWVLLHKNGLKRSHHPKGNVIHIIGKNETLRFTFSSRIGPTWYYRLDAVGQEANKYLVIMVETFDK
jgi:hypothetical protein